MNFEKYFTREKALIDGYLNDYLPKGTEYPLVIHQAMRYSVFTGGKRIRPIIVLAACEACGGMEQDAIHAACGIELIHAYSLVHDDLPAMDNDDFRRGKLTCHKKFNEAIAILAGDALLISGLALITRCSRVADILNTIMSSCGSKGMIGGQVVDIAVNESTELTTFEYIGTHKTGMFIAASAKVGAIIAGASEELIEQIYKFGEYIGLAFQVTDDILDNVGYAQHLGPQEAKREARRLVNKANEYIEVLGSKAVDLKK